MSRRVTPLWGGLFFLLTLGLLYLFARDQFLTHIVLAESPRYARPLWHIGLFFIPLLLFNAVLSFAAARLLFNSRRAVEIELFSPALINDFVGGERVYVSSASFSTLQLGYIFLAVTSIAFMVCIRLSLGIFQVKDLFILVLAGFGLWYQTAILVFRLATIQKAKLLIFRRHDRFSEALTGPALAVFIFFNLALAGLLAAYLRAPDLWPL